MPKYEEPGAWTPFLAFMFVFLGLGYAAWAQPWKDGFAKLKTQLGIASDPSIVGDWEVNRIVYGAEVASTMGMQEAAVKGVFAFQKDQKFRANILVKPMPVKAEGRYQLIAGKLAMRDTTSTPLNAFPAEIDCVVNWVTQEQVAATFPNQTVVFMNRTKGIEQAAKVMGYKIAGEAMKRVPDEEVK